MKEKERTMNVKKLLLRVAMLAAIFVGIASLNQPARASGCFQNVFCETDTSAGRCGGRDFCLCLGFDGSTKEDVIDCALL
jgi:hypothetical protein